MRAAGLTRGGFYAHFASKSDLFAAVVGGDVDLARRLRASREAAAGDPAGSAREVIAGYLDPANRERVAGGCTLATLTADLSRASGTARAAHTERFRELHEEFQHLVPKGSTDAESRALAAIALCVGALALARSLEDENLARDLLTSCADRAVAELADAPQPPSTRQ
jgi:TetR/AcrR family transcriptional repressor of nem operon